MTEITQLIPTIMFYLFSGVLTLCALAVITVKNPVHAVFFLILAFFNAAGLFILIGAEYLAMTLIIVYVGAVAVLFLFVVMMLDVNFSVLREGFMRHLPAGVLVAVVLFAELLLVFYRSLQVAGTAMENPVEAELVSQLTNTRAIGTVLYTDYVYPFQLAGLILLVAMIGAIVLTLRSREGVKRQNIPRQLARKRAETMEVVKVETGRGI